MRNGDFSALIADRTNIASTANTVIYNPFSGVTSGSNVVRTSFGCPTSGAATPTCNIIPSSLFNQTALALLKFYPLPNATGTNSGTQSNYFSNVIRHEKYRAWLTRIDHRISNKQSIFGKYYHSFNPEDRYDWAQDSQTSFINGTSITQGFEDRTNDGGNVDYTNTVSPSMVFDLRVSFNKFTQERHPALALDPSTLAFSASALAAFRGYQYFPMIEIRNLDAIRPIRADLGSMRSD